MAVKAINKYGRILYFKESIWEAMPKHRNGWVEYTLKDSADIPIPDKVIEFQEEKKRKDAVAESIKEPEIIEVAAIPENKIKSPVRTKTIKPNADKKQKNR